MESKSDSLQDIHSPINPEHYHLVEQISRKGDNTVEKVQCEVDQRTYASKKVYIENYDK